MAWAAWTKQGLVDRYEVPADKITVIPPGVDFEPLVGAPARRAATTATSRTAPVLFVGGDLERKGGLVLLDAVRPLRDAGRADRARPRHARRPVPDREGRPWRTTALTPNSPQLIELYHRADVFCLPTLGDCLPMVLSEAGAVGLPLVSTDVGAIGEIVRDGETGLLVPVDDVGALAATLAPLAVRSATLRRRLGDAARSRSCRARSTPTPTRCTSSTLLLDVAAQRTPASVDGR